MSNNLSSREIATTLPQETTQPAIEFMTGASNNNQFELYGFVWKRSCQHNKVTVFVAVTCQRQSRPHSMDEHLEHHLDSPFQLLCNTAESHEALHTIDRRLRDLERENYQQEIAIRHLKLAKYDDMLHIDKLRLELQKKITECDELVAHHRVCSWMTNLGDHDTSSRGDHGDDDRSHGDQDPTNDSKNSNDKEHFSDSKEHNTNNKDCTGDNNHHSDQAPLPKDNGAHEYKAGFQAVGIVHNTIMQGSPVQPYSSVNRNNAAILATKARALARMHDAPPSAAQYAAADGTARSSDEGENFNCTSNRAKAAMLAHEARELAIRAGIAVPEQVQHRSLTAESSSSIPSTDQGKAAFIAAQSAELSALVLEDANRPGAKLVRRRETTNTQSSSDVIREPVQRQKLVKRDPVVVAAIRAYKAQQKDVVSSAEASTTTANASDVNDGQSRQEYEQSTSEIHKNRESIIQIARQASNGGRHMSAAESLRFVTDATDLQNKYRNLPDKDGRTTVVAKTHTQEDIMSTMRYISAQVHQYHRADTSRAEQAVPEVEFSEPSVIEKLDQRDQEDITWQSKVALATQQKTLERQQGSGTSTEITKFGVTTSGFQQTSLPPLELTAPGDTYNADRYKTYGRVQGQTQNVTEHSPYDQNQVRVYDKHQIRTYDSTQTRVYDTTQEFRQKPTVSRLDKGKGKATVSSDAESDEFAFTAEQAEILVTWHKTDLAAKDVLGCASQPGTVEQGAANASSTTLQLKRAKRGALTTIEDDGPLTGTPLKRIYSPRDAYSKMEERNKKQLGLQNLGKLLSSASNTATKNAIGLPSSSSGLTLREGHIPAQPGFGRIKPSEFSSTGLNRIDVQSPSTLHAARKLDQTRLSKFSGQTIYATDGTRVPTSSSYPALVGSQPAQHSSTPAIGPTRAQQVAKHGTYRQPIVEDDEEEEFPMRRPTRASDGNNRSRFQTPHGTAGGARVAQATKADTQAFDTETASDADEFGPESPRFL